MSMIRRILALDGVNVICHFRDDGYLLEGYGLDGSRRYGAAGAIRA
jgi:hypothetical protein